MGAHSGRSEDPERSEEGETSYAAPISLDWLRTARDPEDTLGTPAPPPAGRVLAMGNLHRNQRITLLQSVPLFSACTTSQLAQVESLTTQRSVRSGQVVAKRGEPGLDFFVVASGRAIVTRRGIRIGTLGPGSFFGELALFDGGRRIVTVVAESDMHLIVLSRRAFNTLYHCAPAVVRKVLTELGARLRRVDEMLDPSPALGRSVGPWSL